MGATKRQVLIAFESASYPRTWPADDELDKAPPFGRELANDVVQLLKERFVACCFQEEQGWGIYTHTKTTSFRLYVHFLVLNEEHRWGIELTGTRRWFRRDEDAAAEFADMKALVGRVVAQIPGARDIRWLTKEEAAGLQ